MMEKMCKDHGTGNCKCAKFAPLFLRLALGGIMLYHGILKLQDIGATAGFFDVLNIPMPEIVAWIIALFETIAGVAILLGAYTSLVTMLVTVEIIIALLLTMSAKPYFINTEFDLIVILTALALGGMGAGIHSFDAKKRNMKSTSEQSNQQKHI